MKRYDVIVIGGGLLGCFVGRNLCRWKMSIALIEAREDVCTGISRANTAIVYPGYDHKPGTLKAKFTVRANKRFDTLCEELNVPFSRCGSLMLSLGEKADAVLYSKYEQGLKNGVSDLRLLTGKEALQIEPVISKSIASALYAPSAGTVNPWKFGIAAYENASANGMEAYLNTCVYGLRQESKTYIVETNRGEYSSAVVINCTGLEADRIQALLFSPSVRILQNAGDYLILDRETEGVPQHILQFEPETGGKGIAAVPTVEGSLLIGPSEREPGIPFASTEPGLSFVRTQAAMILPHLDLNKIIRSFGAVRPNPYSLDGRRIGSFVIDHPDPGFWSLIGVKTPGLTCADELGFYLAEKAASYLDAVPNDDFCGYVTGIQRVRDMSVEQRSAAIQKDPDYGEIVCCCEEVTRSEVREAIRRGACTIDAIKRRTDATMGLCQGARCQQKLAVLLAEELGIEESAVTKDGAGSEFLGEEYETM